MVNKVGLNLDPDKKRWATTWTAEMTFPQPTSDCEWAMARTAKHEALSQIQETNSLQFLFMIGFVLSNAMLLICKTHFRPRQLRWVTSSQVADFIHIL